MVGCKIEIVQALASGEARTGPWGDLNTLLMAKLQAVVASMVATAITLGREVKRTIVNDTPVGVFLATVK